MFFRVNDELRRWGERDKLRNRHFSLKLPGPAGSEDRNGKTMGQQSICMKNNSSAGNYIDENLVIRHQYSHYNYISMSVPKNILTRQQKINHMDWLNPSVDKSLLHGKWDVGQVDYLLLLCLVVLNWLHSIFSSIIVFFRNTQSYRLHSRASSSQHYSTPRNMYDHAILIRPIFLQCTIVVPTMLGSVHLVCDIRI